MQLEQSIDDFVSRLSAAGVPFVRADNRNALTELNARLPSRLALSFGTLLRCYSFPPFDVCGMTMFAWNSDWRRTGYFTATSGKNDPMSESLLPAGYLQIGRPDSGGFDAICLDLKSGNQQRIVQIDHEEILCNYRIKVVAELWPSFDDIIGRVRSGAGCGIYYEEPAEYD